MKKTLLTVLASALLSTVAFAQDPNLIQSTDGFSYNCELDTSATKQFSWGYYGPNCSGIVDGGGGFDAAPVNELSYKWGQGSRGKMYVILELAKGVDLTKNSTISVKLRNTSGNTGAALPLNYRVSLEALGYVHLTDSIVVPVTGTSTTFNFNFARHVKSNVDLTKVTRFVFLYDGCLEGPTVYDGTTNPVKIYFSEFKVGSFATVGVEDELLSRISESALYPNPTSGQVNVKLNLNTTSHVKVVLKDAQGNAVRTLTEQSTNVIDQAFNLSDLATGLYFISYQIEGAAVKTQKLLIN